MEYSVLVVTMYQLAESEALYGRTEYTKKHVRCDSARLAECRILCKVVIDACK